MAEKLYSGSLARRYIVDVPADPGWARPEAHRADEGHLVDTSGRDEAPRGGGWLPQEALEVQPSLPGGSPAEFTRTHQRMDGHEAGEFTRTQGSAKLDAPLRYLRAFPQVPNTPQDLDTAGAGGAFSAGLRNDGMMPRSTTGRRTVDGRATVGTLDLGHDYFHPIERVYRALHLNRPRLRRIPQPAITRERGGASPGGYSSQYDASASSWSAGPRNPMLRRLIRPYGQREYDETDQHPGAARRGNPGPIGNGGW